MTEDEWRDEVGRRDEIITSLTGLLVDEQDTQALHYAAGLLMGLHAKYGDHNVVIYHDSVRVRVEQIGRWMVAEDI